LRLAAALAPSRSDDGGAPQRQALGPDPFSAPAKAKKADLTADFADIGRELARPQSLTELRQLRRRCALLLHPDRVAPWDRSLAENFMAEVNAAIDSAIKDKNFATPKL
jgi:hypothetical protein